MGWMENELSIILAVKFTIKINRLAEQGRLLGL